MIRGSRKVRVRTGVRSNSTMILINQALKSFPSKQPPTQPDRHIREDQAKNKIFREERVGPPHQNDDSECPNHSDVEGGNNNCGSFEGK